MRVALEIFCFFFIFCKIKGWIHNEYISFTDYASRIQLQDCSKLAVNWKKGNDFTILRHEVMVKCFWRCFISRVKFSYWSKFHVNSITGSGVITISFYKGLTRNPEVLPNIWRLVRVKSSRFSMNVTNKMLLNVAKCQGYGFYRFWVIKGKPNGAVKLPPPPNTEVGVNLLENA